MLFNRKRNRRGKITATDEEGVWYLFKFVLKLVDLSEGINELLLLIVDGLLCLRELFQGVLPLKLNTFDIRLLR
jgi:hypothetical protein